MKKLLTILCITCALALVANAGDAKGKEGKKKHALTTEQKEARKSLLEKYDANKDGKLDKEELSKATASEKEKAGYAKKKGEKTEEKK